METHERQVSGESEVALQETIDAPPAKRAKLNPVLPDAPTSPSQEAEAEAEAKEQQEEAILLQRIEAVLSGSGVLREAVSSVISPSQQQEKEDAVVRALFAAYGLAEWSQGASVAQLKQILMSVSECNTPWHVWSTLPWRLPRRPLSGTIRIESIAQLADVIRQAQSILVLAGAGISTSCGIPVRCRVWSRHSFTHC